MVGRSDQRLPHALGKITEEAAAGVLSAGLGGVVAPLLTGDPNRGPQSLEVRGNRERAAPRMQTARSCARSTSA
ncbi:MAG: hypothetical protein Q8P67_14375 [archaeon]|nr:hypothetical protein [archaeon]